MLRCQSCNFGGCEGDEAYEGDFTEAGGTTLCLECARHDYVDEADDTDQMNPVDCSDHWWYEFLRRESHA